MKDLIKIATTLAFLVCGMMNLPKIIFSVRKAQLELVQESKASKWPKAMLLRK